MEWVCGFANAQGGKIYIGVNDQREVVGVKDSKRLMEDIPNKIVSHLGLVEDVNLLQANDLDYIEIVVKPSNLPISCRGRYFYRSGSTRQELVGVSLQQFILKKLNITWDSSPCIGATIDDIDEEAINFFVRRAVRSGRIPSVCSTETIEQILKRLHLFTQDGMLTMAAVLLFGKDIEQWTPLAAFRLGRFGSNDSDLIIDDFIVAPLIMMPVKLVETLRNKYLIAPIKYNGLERVEQLEIPEEGLREMLCNALIHKDYQGTYIQMKVWDDRVTIWNPGRLPENFTIEKLLGVHESCPRNPLIARVFYLAGFIEAWGRGYTKILDSFAEAKLTQPSFEEVRGGVMATIKREVFMSVRGNVGQDNENVGQGVGQGTIQEGVQNDTLEKWIEFHIRMDNKITTEELAILAGKTTRTIKRYIAKMTHIQYVGSGYSGYWKIDNRKKRTKQ